VATNIAAPVVSMSFLQAAMQAVGLLCKSDRHFLSIIIFLLVFHVFSGIPCFSWNPNFASKITRIDGIPCFSWYPMFFLEYHVSLNYYVFPGKSSI
jgi:hypothetical protein